MSQLRRDWHWRYGIYRNRKTRHLSQVMTQCYPPFGQWWRLEVLLCRKWLLQSGPDLDVVEKDLLFAAFRVSVSWTTYKMFCRHFSAFNKHITKSQIVSSQYLFLELRGHTDTIHRLKLLLRFVRLVYIFCEQWPTPARCLQLHSKRQQKS